jgi:hypothetical protein
MRVLVSCSLLRVINARDMTDSADKADEINVHNARCNIMHYSEIIDAGARLEKDRKRHARYRAP